MRPILRGAASRSLAIRAVAGTSARKATASSPADADLADTRKESQ
jgi:hypothetical protein